MGAALSHPASKGWGGGDQEGVRRDDLAKRGEIDGWAKTGPGFRGVEG